MRAILTYHSIDPSGSPISCHPDVFVRHVSWLASRRVRVTTIDELLRLPSETDAVALTFDDGYVNFRDVAAPRLLDHGLPVTLFVVAGRVGERNAWDDRPGRRIPDLPLLDWPALIRLQEQGVTLGAHSLTHRSLPRLGPGVLEDEVRGSADLIEAHAGRRPAIFAYPYGDFSPASSKVVSRVFAWACTTEFQPITESPQPWALPRLDMGYFARTHSLGGWGTSWFTARIHMRNRLRRLRSRAAGSRSGR